MTNVDDLPCSCGNGYDFEAKMAQMELEFQQKKQQEEQEFSLPLPQRIQSKNWKCRKSALDEISTKIISLSEFNEDIFKLFPKMTQDTHQGNLEFAIELIINFFKIQIQIPHEHQHVLNETLKNLIEKGYSALKPAIKEKSKDAIVKCCEHLTSMDSLCDIISNLIDTKNQKLIQAAVSISTLLLSLFGSSAFTYKAVIPSMIKTIDACSPSIKNEIIAFITELYKWIRGGVRQYIDNKIKDSTRNDIDKSFEAVTKQFQEGNVASASLKLDNNIIISNNASKKQPVIEVAIPGGDDSEVDVFNNKFGYGEKFVEEIMKPERKWKEKKEMFDSFADAISPLKILKIKNTQRIFFIEMIKIMLKDPNINVINSIIVAIGNMAKGLRNDFTEGRDLFSILIEFFKEKKEKFTNDLMSTLESMITYMDESTICDLMMKYTSQNIPTQSKEKVCTLIEKITTMKKGNVKPLLEIAIKYTDDPAIEVRTAGIKALSFIKEKNNGLFLTIIPLLNEQKIKKIDEILNSKGVTIPTGTSVPVARKQKKEEETKEEQNNVAESNSNDSEVEEIIKSKIGDELYGNFNQSKWDIRRDAFKALAEYITTNKEDVSVDVETYFKFIVIKNKNFKETNINVLKESILTIQALVDNIPSFSKKFSSVILKKVIDKINDAKVRPQIHSLFNAMITSFSPKAISTGIIKAAEGKPVVILKETALYLSTAIDNFNIAQFPVKDITDFCKALEANSNPQCRNAATTLLCGIYKYIGEPLKNFLRDIKEATMKVIDEEFKKVKMVNVQSNSATSNGNASKNPLMESLFPRVDISKKITPKMLKDLAEGKWQLKKEVIDAVEAAINESSNRILPNGLGEFISIVKQKLKDGNKNIVRLLTQLITHLTTAMGVGFKAYTKTLLNPIIKNLSDKNTLLREDVVKCLDNLISTVGFEIVISSFPPFLNEDNLELRTEMIKLILKYKANLPKCDSVKDLIPGVVSCLLDKQPSVRALAEELTKELLRVANISFFYNALKEYKPAIANTVKNVIDKYANLMCVGSDVVMSEERAASMKPNRRNVKYEDNSDDVIMKDATVPSIPNRRSECKSNEPMQNTIIMPTMTIPPITNISTIKPKDFAISTHLNEFSVESTVKDTSKQQICSYEISKSPLIITKTKSCTSSSTNDTISLSSSNLSQIISRLYTGDPSSKITSLIDLTDLIGISPDVITKNIRDIFTALNSTLANAFEQASHNSFDSDLLRSVMTTYFKLAMKKNLLSCKDIPLDIVYNSYEKMLSLLITASMIETPKEEDKKKVVKSINLLMLKLMESFNITASFISLIKLIINYLDSNNEKLCSLSIKCLLKLTNVIKSVINEIEIDKIFVTVIVFIGDFVKRTNTDVSTIDDISPRNQIEDMSIKVIKNLINEIVKLFNNEVWKYYKSALEHCEFNDIFLKRWLTLMLRSKNGISQPVYSTNPIVQRESPIKSNTMPLLVSKIERAATNPELSSLMKFAEMMNKSETYAEKERNVYEIISSIKRNKLNVEFMADKLNQDNYTMLLKIFHSIRDSDDESKAKMMINDKEKENFALSSNTMTNKISPSMNTNTTTQGFRLKTLQEYRNKLYGLSASTQSVPMRTTNDTINSLNSISSSMKNNKQDQSNNLINNFALRRQQMDEELRSKREKMNQINKNISSNISSSNGVQHEQQIDRLTEMKRKLEFLRNQKPNNTFNMN